MFLHVSTAMDPLNCHFSWQKFHTTAAVLSREVVGEIGHVLGSFIGISCALLSYEARYGVEKVEMVDGFCIIVGNDICNDY